MGAVEQFQRRAVIYVLVSLGSVGLWLLRGGDGVIRLRRREIDLGFWPAWVIVIGFALLAYRAWETFGRSNRLDE